MTHRCPTCSQLVRAPAAPQVPVRVCYNCDQPIQRHDKYTLGVNSEGVTVIKHRVCSNPRSYHDAKTCWEIGVVGYKGLTDKQIAEMGRVAAELERKFEEWRVSVGRKKVD